MADRLWRFLLVALVAWAMAAGNAGSGSDGNLGLDIAGSVAERTVSPGGDLLTEPPRQPGTVTLVTRENPADPGPGSFTAPGGAGLLSVAVALALGARTAVRPTVRRDLIRRRGPPPLLLASP